MIFCDGILIHPFFSLKTNKHDVLWSFSMQKAVEDLYLALGMQLGKLNDPVAVSEINSCKKPQIPSPAQKSCPFGADIPFVLDI